MATSCLRTTLLICKTVHTSGGLHRLVSHPLVNNQCVFAVHQNIIVRHGSFFNRRDIDSLWDSVTSVSNQGRKRGRASRGKLMRRTKLKSDFKIGESKLGLYFPGLTGSISGQEKSSDLGIRRIEKKTETDEAEKEETSFKKSKRFKGVDILDAGYTGRKVAGQRIPPPDPIGETSFEDFDAYIISVRHVSHATASQGDIFSFSVMAAIGNKKGLVGLGLGKGSSIRAAVASAKTRAAKQLVYVDRYDDHTVLHNFTEKIHKTTVIVKPSTKGHGLICHPALKLLCNLIGIKDVFVRTEGTKTNYINVCRAFLTGVLKTRTHQELADELGHHIVKYQTERDNFPVVVASPSDNSLKNNFKKPSGFNFEAYCYGNKVPLEKPKRKPFYWNTKGNKKKEARMHKLRNQNDARVKRMVLGFQTQWNSK